MLGTKSDGGETEKLSWRKKSDKKKKCLGDFFCGIWKPDSLELLCVLHDKDVKTKGRNTIYRTWKENKDLSYQVQCIFHTRNYFTKENLFLNRF